MTSALAANLIQRIHEGENVSVSDFMSEAITTYYQRPDVFGRQGDFVTAPEISQIFGELVGLWFAMVWMTSGQPQSFRLLECGPGRGTLMVDALRATKTVPGFHDALDLHLLENSPTLKATQAEALAEYTPTWHTSLASIDNLPDGPLHVIANEFLDALPIQQFEFDGKDWQERMLCVENNALSFTTCTTKQQAALPEDILAEVFTPDATAETGNIVEHSPKTDRFVTSLAKRIADHGGAALIFDYGYTEPGFGDTLQAMSNHTYTDVLSTAGDADLTAHVNFHRVAKLANQSGAKVYGPVTQGDWLPKMGLEARLSSLYQQAEPAQRKPLLSGARRLIDPQAMGRLFKVIALCDPKLSQPEGFSA